MIMRFNAITKNIQAALIRFCMEQEVMNRYADEEEIKNTLVSAFVGLNKILSASLPVVPIYRYHMYAGEQFTDEILPDSIKENGILYDEVIHLGTFKTDSYYANNEKTKTIVRGYDVIYDIYSEEIKLLYRILTSDEDVTILYRADTDLYEDFEVYEFLFDIISQIKMKLTQNVQA